MRRAVVVAGIVSLCACTPKATEPECQAACTKQAALASAGKPNPAEGAATAAAAELAPKIAEAQKALADEVAKIDTDLGAKLTKAKGKAKDKLTAEIAKKKEAATTAHQPKIDELVKAQAAAVADARSKAETAARTASEQAQQACVSACVQAGTTKPKADCQANAATLDDFAKCQ